MKKIVSVIICMTLVLSLAACCSNEETPPSDTKEVNHIPLSDDGPENEITISLPDFDLDNAILCEASGRYMKLDDSVFGQVFLLGKHYNDDAVIMEYFLAIVTEEKTICEDLNICLGSNIDVCDFDGDGDCEVLLQQTVGMTGGAGSYLSRIFDYRDGQILEIFSSDSIFKKYSKNMGFTCTLLTNKEIRIDNEFTNYSETFSMSDRPDEYFKWWYQDDGSIVDRELMVDSFYKFVPIDTDFDGVYEVFCRQYTSLVGHTDGIGSTTIVLKFNSESSEFEIIDAGFELYKYAS